MTKIFLILFLLVTAVKAQTKMHPFTLDGKVNLDSGTVRIELISTSYYPESLSNWEGKIINGSFNIQGEIPASIGIRIFFTSNKITYMSEIAVLDIGKQTLIYDYRNPRSIDMQNRSMSLYEKFNQQSNPARMQEDLIYAQLDSLSLLYKGNIPLQQRGIIDSQLKEAFQKSDKVLKEFIDKNPNSYLGFWKFVRLFNGWGYEPGYDDVYEKFSDSIKLSFAGRTLAEKLAKASKLDIGSPFPFMNIVDLKNLKLDKKIFKTKKYTLIDLWFSYCVPCRRQFPHLKELYNTYNKKGFDIIGITTDKAKDREDWLKAIKDNELPWLQYWDINGVESAAFSINAFPTSLLVDENGIIIAKNISFSELSGLLQKL